MATARPAAPAAAPPAAAKACDVDRTAATGRVWAERVAADKGGEGLEPTEGEAVSGLRVVLGMERACIMENRANKTVFGWVFL